MSYICGSKHGSLSCGLTFYLFPLWYPQAAFELIVEPIVQAYAPDLIIVAAGFDAARVSDLSENTYDTA